jgi:hypothetical protein
MTEAISAVPFLSSLEVPFLFDHVAHAGPHQNHADQEFSELLAILKTKSTLGSISTAPTNYLKQARPNIWI